MQSVSIACCYWERPFLQSFRMRMPSFTAGFIMLASFTRCVKWYWGAVKRTSSDPSLTLCPGRHEVANLGLRSMSLRVNAVSSPFVIRGYYLGMVVLSVLFNPWLFLTRRLLTMKWPFKMESSMDSSGVFNTRLFVSLYGQENKM